jgi:hypothetical protein
VVLSSLTTTTPAMIVTKAVVITEATGAAGILKGRIELNSYSPVTNLLIASYSLPFRTTVNLTTDQILRMTITFNSFGNSWITRSGITLMEA